MSEQERKDWERAKSPHEVEAEKLRRDYEAVERGENVVRMGCALSQDNGGSGWMTRRKGVA